MAFGSGNRRSARAEQVPPLDPNDAGFLRELAPELGGFVDQGPQRHITSALSFPPAQTQHQTKPSIVSHTGAPTALETYGAASRFTFQTPAAVELGGDGAVEDWEAPDDVVAALQLLATQFPAAAIAAGCGPLMLKNQVYAVVEHRTTVDRRLDSLRESGALRMFKLSSGTADDYAYLFASDYADLVRAQRAILEAAGSTPDQLAVLGWFLARVVPRAREASISHAQLLSLLSGPAPLEDAPISGRGRGGLHGGRGTPLMGASQSCSAGPARKRPRLRNMAPGSEPNPKGVALGSESSATAEVPGAARESPCQSNDAAPLDDSPQRLDPSGAEQHPGNCGTPSDRDRAVRAVHGHPECSTTAAGGCVGGVSEGLPVAVTDAHISVLLNGGLIARHPQQAASYLFSVPTTGPLVKSIAKGRVELLGLVTRRRYGEMREKDLEDHSLQRSLMDMRFHVRDLIGMGALQRVQTTSGTLLRAPKRK